MNSIIIVSVLCVIAIIVCRYINYLSIKNSNELQLKLFLLENPDLAPPEPPTTPKDSSKSPFIIKPEYHSKSGKWGYSIYNTKTSQFESSPEGMYVVYFTFENAVKGLHIMEKGMKYELSKF